MTARKKPATKPAAKKKANKPAQAPQADRPLTPKQERFVQEYLIDLNATQAAIRAGYSARNADKIGPALVGKIRVRAAISAMQERRAKRTEIDADRILTDLEAITRADPRELMQVKLGCCRYCYGHNFGYQRTVGEMNHDREQYLLRYGTDEKAAPFDEKGGIGFDPRKLPNPDCPSCGGDGTPRVALADTRELSAQARLLYAGAKVTRNGIEILTHSQTDARDKLMRHLGLYKDRVEHTGADGGPIEVAAGTPLDFEAIRAKRQAKAGG